MSFTRIPDDPETRSIDVGYVEGILAESIKRPSMRVCPACHGEGGWVSYTPGSRMPDPQTEVVCPRCEGEGVVPR